MKIAPSVLTAGFNCLETELESINRADLIHLDIMDGHFVPNISFGPHVVKSLSKITNIPFDIHLMTTNPLNWIEKFIVPQTRFITVHVESEGFLEAIKKIKARGLKAGITLKPKTALAAIKPYLNMVDLVLVMSVEPGFGGQLFMPEALERIKELAEIKKDNNYTYEIEVDGGINKETGTACKKLGATILVAGSYLFSMKNRNQGIEALKK